MAGGQQTDEHNAIENQVAKSWRDVTGMDRLGDGSAATLASLDFYEVGGVDPWLAAWMDMQDSHLEPSDDEDDDGYEDYDDEGDD